jgi:glycosyltransferase involved in cell wall biosynthesis
MKSDPELNINMPRGEGATGTVLQVLPELAGGGVERGTVEIARALTQAGWGAVVVSSGGGMVHELARVGAEHITLPVDSKNPLVMWKNAGRLAEVIRSSGVDLVHARSRAPAWSAFLAARRTKRPFVTTFHAAYGRGNPAKNAYNAIMAKGQRVIAISKFLAGHVSEHYGVEPPRLVTIPRGVDLKRFNPGAVSAERVIKLARAWRLPDDMPVVMLPGRLTRIKGQAVLIEAMARLERDDVFTILVGGDERKRRYRAELEALVEARGLAGNMRIVDRCDDMPAAYMLADAVVSATTVPEGFGRVAAEAQAMGRPVIATNHGGSREIVIPGVTGWLITPDDPEALARAISQTLSLDTDARESVAAVARSHIAENFSLEGMCAATLEVYSSVLERARSENR